MKLMVGMPTDGMARTINDRKQIIDTVIKPSDRVLDVGVGGGAYAKIYKDNFYVGVDYTPEHLVDAAHHCMAARVTADQLPLKDSVFDLVLLIETIEHIPKDADAVKESFRVLTNGGRLVITFPNKLFPMETHGARLGDRMISTGGVGVPLLPLMPILVRDRFANATVYTPWRAEQMLRDAGFKVVDARYLPPGLDTLGKHHPLLYRFASKIFLLPISKMFLATIVLVGMREK